jgi:hypothetical protein
MDTNETIAEWCGFKWVKGEIIKPNGDVILGLDIIPKNRFGELVPDFTRDLNAWNKWAFPEIQKRWDFIDIMWDYGAWDICLMNYTTNEKRHLGLESGETYDTLLEALCEMTLKLIEGING